MKLLKKYRTYTYTSLVLAIIIGFVANYHIYKHVQKRTADEVIYEYREDIEEYASKHKTLKTLMTVNSKFGMITLADDSYQPSEQEAMIKDTLAYDHYQDDRVVYRKIVFPVYTEDGTYIVQLMAPLLENDYFVGTIIFSLFILSIIFVIFTSVLDQLFTRKIFRPFHKILIGIKSYNLGERRLLKLETNDIDEFNELIKNLDEMVKKINNGYREMKDFLEFTSHELQTPLSVIQLKLELLNEKSCNEEVLNSISSIQTSVRKVIRFNRSILFIAKINNGQFKERKLTNLSFLISDYQMQYAEMISMKNIQFTIQSKGDCKALINPVLAEYLIQNILTNSIKHNYVGGEVEILSDCNQLQISNTYDGNIPKGNLFEKYNHTNDGCESSGLGLALVKTICHNNQIEVSYNTISNRFILTLKLKNRRN